MRFAEPIRQNLFFPIPEGNASSYLAWIRGLSALSFDARGFATLGKRIHQTLLRDYRIIKELGVNFTFDFRHQPFFNIDFVYRKLNSITCISDSLSNQESRDNYARAMFASPFEHFNYFLNTVLRKTQYFEYLKLRGGQIIFNCGVDNGWELPFYLGGTCGALTVYNFDPAGFAKLAPYARYVVMHERFSNSFKEIKSAVWNKSCRLKISENNTIKEIQENLKDHEETVEAITIDEFCEENNIERIDIIKMDIEGAEPYVIEGMMKSVIKHRPQLAICVYHDIEHFIDIPEMLINSLKDYRFYFGTYNYDLGESVFYCIPGEIDSRADVIRIEA